MPQTSSTIKQLDLVNCILKSGVLKIDNLKHKKYRELKKQYWQAIHKHALELGLATSEDFMNTRTKLWNPLKKRAQESLILLREKQIDKLPHLHKVILMGLGQTEAELNALEEPSNNSMAIVKRERTLNHEVILPDTHALLKTSCVY